MLNDPGLRKTNFVMVHGGWPFTREIGALLTKPNAYLDFSQQSLLIAPTALAATLREWLGFVPGESDVRDGRVPVFRRDRLGGIGRDGRACGPAERSRSR